MAAFVYITWRAQVSNISTKVGVWSQSIFIFRSITFIYGFSPHSFPFPVSLFILFYFPVHQLILSTPQTHTCVSVYMCVKEINWRVQGFLWRNLKRATVLPLQLTYLSRTLQVKLRTQALKCSAILMDYDIVKLSVICW